MTTPATEAGAPVGDAERTLAILESQKALARLRQDMKQKVFWERGDEIDILALAVLSGYPALFLGPPGTAKTEMVKHFASRLDLPFFTLLATKFSTPDALWGPLDLRQLRDTGRYVHSAQAGYVQNSRAVFLDECFKGTAEFLNSLLKALGEKLWEDDGVDKPLALDLFVGASNEIMGEEDNVAALNNRLVLRKQVNYLTQPALRLLMRATMDNTRGGTIDPNDPSGTKLLGLSLDQLLLLREAVEETTFADPELEGFFDILGALTKEGLPRPSDRQVLWAQRIVRSHAVMRGRQAGPDGKRHVQPDDLACLRWVLWDDPDQEAKCASVVLKVANPMLEKARGMRDTATVAMQTLDKQLKEAGTDDLKKTTAYTRCYAALEDLLKQLNSVHNEARGAGRDATAIKQFGYETNQLMETVANMQRSYRAPKAFESPAESSEF